MIPDIWRRERITWKDWLFLLAMGGFGIGPLLLMGILWVMIPTMKFVSWLFDKIGIPFIIVAIALSAYEFDYLVEHITKYWQYF